MTTENTTDIAEIVDQHIDSEVTVSNERFEHPTIVVTATLDSIAEYRELKERVRELVREHGGNEMIFTCVEPEAACD